MSMAFLSVHRWTQERMLAPPSPRARQEKVVSVIWDWVVSTACIVIPEMVPAACVFQLAVLLPPAGSSIVPGPRRVRP